MNRRIPRATLGIAAALTASLLTTSWLNQKATGLPKANDLDKVSLGEHWYGPEISLKDLDGHVVLYEFWGIN